MAAYVSVSKYQHPLTSGRDFVRNDTEEFTTKDEDVKKEKKIIRSYLSGNFRK